MGCFMLKHALEIAGIFIGFMMLFSIVPAVIIDRKERRKIRERLKNVMMLLFGAFVVCGCSHAQVPPASSNTVVLTWQESTSGTTFVVYRCTTSATACADTTNTGWSQIGTATTTTYTDTTPPTGTVYYDVEALLSGINSAPSNVASATVTALNVPVAPTLGAPTVSQNGVPEGDDKQLANVEMLRAVTR
jgi:hypothetical protein